MALALVLATGCGEKAPGAEEPPDPASPGGRAELASAREGGADRPARDGKRRGRARERGADDRRGERRGPGEPAPDEAGSGPARPAGLRLEPIEAADSWWTEVTDEMGVNVVHVAGDTSGFHLPQIIGSGAALFDPDGDGDLDLYLLNGGPDPAEPNERGDVKNRLLANEGGKRFREVEGAGLDGSAYGQGVAVGDLDNDGDDDVFLANWGFDQLFANSGDGTFAEVTGAAGVAGAGGMSTSAAFFDPNRDGFLDLYVAEYVEYLPGKRCFDFADRHDYCGPSAFEPASDLFYENAGDGTLVDRSQHAGLNSRKAAGLGVVCLDLNDDGWQDVFVSNDGYENHLWTNHRDGTFVEDAVILGVAFNQSGQAEAGMGVLADDFDGDGSTDFFLTHLTNETNTLYRNLGGGTGFVDWTGRSGLASSSLSMTGFGTAAIDVEADGDLDLLVVNGRVKRGTPYEDADRGDHWNDYAEPNLFYLNDGRGRFVSGRAHGLAFTDRLEVSRGLTIGDIDGDSDPDLVVTGLDERARIFRNDAPRQGRVLAVEAWEPELSREAVGARVTLELGGRRLARVVSRSQGYLASNDPRVCFGSGQATKEELRDAILAVQWPDGSKERFPVPGWDRTVRVVHGQGENVP